MSEQSERLDTLDSLVRWTCLLCGRDKFDRPGQPHNCTGGFRKRFKAEAARCGLDNAWVQTPNAEHEPRAKRSRAPCSCSQFKMEEVS
jgi:hypothetical protein